MQVILTTIGLLLFSFVAMAESANYQTGIDDAAILAQQKKCYKLTNKYHLSAAEFARIRAFCWHKQDPTLVQNNAAYNSPALAGVRSNLTSSEQWDIDEEKIKRECGKKRNFKFVKGDKSKNIHSSCNYCKSGAVLTRQGSQLLCLADENSNWARGERKREERCNQIANSEYKPGDHERETAGQCQCVGEFVRQNITVPGVGKSFECVLPHQLTTVNDTNSNGVIGPQNGNNQGGGGAGGAGGADGAGGARGGQH